MKKLLSLSMVLCFLFVCPITISTASVSGDMLDYAEAIERLNNISLTDINELDLITRSLEAIGHRYFAPQYRVVTESLRELAREGIGDDLLEMIETALKMLSTNKAFTADYLSHDSLAFLPLEGLISYVAARRLESQGENQEAYDAYAATQVLDSLSRGIRLMATEPTAESTTKVEDAVVRGNVSSISFGKYEQDNDIMNGSERIEWRVLAQKDGRTLLISEYNLECLPYNINAGSSSWETSTLREWLNGAFLNSAFTEEEKGAIVAATHSDEHAASEIDATQDMVFILDQKEVEEYFKDEADRIAFNTPHATVKGASRDDSNTGWWWLRWSDVFSKDGSGVNRDGSFDPRDKNAYYGDEAVRPAMWIDLSKFQTIESQSSKNDSNAEISLLGLSRFESGTYSFTLEKIDWSKIIVNDPANELLSDTKVYRNHIEKPVTLRISMSVTGSNNVMMLFMSDNDERLHWTREDVAAGGSAQIVVDITEEDIKSVGDTMWMLNFTNFDSQNDADVVVTISTN